MANILFHLYTEDQVWASLDGPISESPIATEVNRLMTAYVATYPMLPSIVYLEPRWPIEKVALDLAKNYF